MTTVNLITNGMLTLLRNPEVLHRLREDARLAVPLVEELLRFEPPCNCPRSAPPSRTSTSPAPPSPGAPPSGSSWPPATGTRKLALTELARRLDGPRLLEDPPPYRQNAVLRGPRHLNVAFDGLRS